MSDDLELPKDDELRQATMDDWTKYAELREKFETQVKMIELQVNPEQQCIYLFLGDGNPMYYDDRTPADSSAFDGYTETQRAVTVARLRTLANLIERNAPTVGRNV